MTVAADRNQLGGLTRADSIGGPGGAAADAKPAVAGDAILVDEPAAPAAEAISAPAPALPRRRPRSSLTRRILTLNLLALAIPVAGLLYLDQYRNSLVQQQLDLMATEAELFSGALAASGVVTGPAGDERLLPETTRSTVMAKATPKTFRILRRTSRTAAAIESPPTESMRVPRTWR